MAGLPYGPIERSLIVFHRWLGIVLVLLMTLWTLSGIVMLYMAFPALTETEHYSGLETIDLGDCCDESVAQQLEGLSGFAINMMAGRPVARVESPFGAAATLDLRSGQWLEGVSEELAADIAAAHLVARGKTAVATNVEEIHNDQWTVYARFHAHRPLYKVSTDSAAGDVIYVSSTTGEVVQDTHRWERFWNWLGAVPHWLYFTAFRELQSVWYQFVVWSSVLGTILVASGLYLGIKRTLAAKGRWTRYLGPMRLHHVTGLIFGVLTLTWVLSGLFSMQPWGLLEGGGAGEEMARVDSGSLTADEINSIFLQVRSDANASFVNMDIKSHRAATSIISVGESGERTRLDAIDLSIDSVEHDELLTTLGEMRPNATIGSIELLREEDAYYFGHKEPVQLPVYRAILDDSELTRYYFDAATGELLQRTGSAEKWYRWLHHGLHRLDFSSLLRSRPLWDIIILPLLLGVSFLCFVGCRVGYRRLRTMRVRRR